MHVRCAQLAVGVLVALGAGCSSEHLGTPDPWIRDSAGVVMAVVIEPAGATLVFQGDTLALRATAINPAGYALLARAAVWSSGDTTVATISEAGVVRATGRGTVEVAARIEGTTGTATFTVEPGIAVENDCTRCHWARRPGGHFAWGFTQASCGACHDLSEAGHGTAFREHALAAGFPLAGAHATLPCEDCHVAGTDSTAVSPDGPADCVACHAAAWAAEHAAAGFPTTCASCHTTAAWTPASFDHAALANGFALVGAHRGLVCGRCHDAATFAPLFDPAGTEDCLACHRPLYDAQHGSDGYPTACLRCHSVDSWDGATFDHGSASGGFTLTVPHASLACTACHEPDTFAPRWTPADAGDCYACHADDYAGEHGAQAYPTTCLLCHDGLTWDGASFDHTAASGGFELVGPHLSLPCTACHDPATWQPKWSPASRTDCNACHGEDAPSAHVSLAYPADCARCHTATSWQNVSFDHDRDYFPVFSGRHRARWSTCSACHVAPADFAVFSCLGCHDETETRSNHGGVSAFRYESAECYRCHPRGEG